MSDEGKTFRVQDKRRFDADGNLKPADAEGTQEPADAEATERADVADAEPASSPEAPRADAAPSGSPARGAPAASPADAMPEEPPARVGFSELVLSVATNALAFLGRDDPGSEARVSGSKVNLKLAAQNIDILAMLEEKTRGNLSSSEAELLGSVLYDLRTLYVDTAREVGD